MRDSYAVVRNSYERRRPSVYLTRYCTECLLRQATLRSRTQNAAEAAVAGLPPIAARPRYCVINKNSPLICYLPLRSELSTNRLIHGRMLTLGF